VRVKLECRPGDGQWFRDFTNRRLPMEAEDRADDGHNDDERQEARQDR
jgi:hypothetical protein